MFSCCYKSDVFIVGGEGGCLMLKMIYQAKIIVTQTRQKCHVRILERGQGV
jgi:hypothetical protein